MKNNKGFNLINVIIIMCITSIISGITAGVIVTNGYNKKTGLSYNELASDNNLKEFLEVYFDGFCWNDSELTGTGFSFRFAE